MKSEQEEAAQGPRSAPATRDFVWSNCGNENLSTRVAVKQQAVDDAFEYAHQLRDRLREEISYINEGSLIFDLMGGREIIAWSEEMGEY
jgi:hypothetical protein